MAYQGACGECGRSFDQLKSTAKDWREYCRKDCEARARKRGKGGSGGGALPVADAIRVAQGVMADDGPLPTPTVTTGPIMGGKGDKGGSYTPHSHPPTSPTSTTRQGGLEWNWPATPGSKDPKGATFTGKTCVHNGLSEAFTLRGGQVTVYGARASSLMAPGAKVEHLGVIIDASGNVNNHRFVETGSPRYLDLNSGVFPEVVRLRWPDMSAPTHVGIVFWQSLLLCLPPTVCISCVGSHGRTGTAMAALLVADGMEAVAAIKLVRDQHCKHAIETAGQGEYVKDLERQRKALTGK